MSDKNKTLKRARGLNSIANPSDFKGIAGRQKQKLNHPSDSQEEVGSAQQEPVLEIVDSVGTTKNTSERRSNRESQSKASKINKRTRRELSIPNEIAEKLKSTRLNPTDVVMASYRKFNDDVYAGAGSRGVQRGRVRLRLSITDIEFDQITRLGNSRGWNRSETVAVLLSLYLSKDE